MRVRPLERGDIEGTIDLAEEMWKESPRYQNRDFSRDKLYKFGESILRNPLLCGFVAVNGDKLEGFFIGAITEYFFGCERIASDFALFVPHSRRGGIAAIMLIKAYESWARSHHVAEISLGTTTAVDEERTVSLYKMLGFNPVGTVCKKIA